MEEIDTARSGQFIFLISAIVHASLTALTWVLLLYQLSFNQLNLQCIEVHQRKEIVSD